MIEPSILSVIKYTEIIFIGKSFGSALAVNSNISKLKRN